MNDIVVRAADLFSRIVSWNATGKEYGLIDLALGIARWIHG